MSLLLFHVFIIIATAALMLGFGTTWMVFHSRKSVSLPELSPRATTPTGVNRMTPVEPVDICMPGRTPRPDQVRSRISSSDLIISS
ncbi:MAG: hypothetical protein AAF539_01270 [Planctomycetota bacterium]